MTSATNSIIYDMIIAYLDVRENKSVYNKLNDIISVINASLDLIKINLAFVNNIITINYKTTPIEGIETINILQTSKYPVILSTTNYLVKCLTSKEIYLGIYNYLKRFEVVEKIYTASGEFRNLVKP